MSNGTDDRESLIREFHAAVAAAHASRLMRLMLHPYKMLFPKYLKAVNDRRDVRATTFWRGAIDVILPEIVSTHIWRYGYFEEDVCAFLLSGLRQGMTFVDIGGHFGFITLLASRLVGKTGRVHAFEPTPSTYLQLQHNVERHAPYANIVLHNIAAYSKSTTLSFHDYGIEYAAFNSAFGIRSTTGAVLKNDISVPADKLDSLLSPKQGTLSNMIKIDAESAEMHVLMGMERILEEQRPAIIMEVGDFDIAGVPRSKEIILWLKARGYMPFEAVGATYREHVVQDVYTYQNLMFVHR